MMLECAQCHIWRWSFLANAQLQRACDSALAPPCARNTVHDGDDHGHFRRSTTGRRWRYGVWYTVCYLQLVEAYDGRDGEEMVRSVAVEAAAETKIVTSKASRLTKVRVYSDGHKWGREFTAISYSTFNTHLSIHRQRCSPPLSYRWTARRRVLHGDLPPRTAVRSREIHCASLFFLGEPSLQSLSVLAQLTTEETEAG